MNVERGGVRNHMKKLILSLFALIMVTGGCGAAPPDTMEVSSSSKGIPIGRNISTNIPESWALEINEDVPWAYVNECPQEDPSESLFCVSEVYVSDASSPRQALLDFLNRKRDFVWFCADALDQICRNDEEKKKQVLKMDDYWYVEGLGIAENAAVTFPVGKVFVTVFGYSEPKDLYQKYHQLFE